MKYYVKNEYGSLTYGSFRELYVLYQRRFVTDDDLIRKEGTERWIPAGLMPELKGARDLVKDKSTPIWAALAACYVGLVVWVLVKYGGGVRWLFALCALVFAVAAGGWWTLRSRARRE